MRIIAVKTLKTYWENYPKAKQSLLALYEEAENSDWNTPNELKSHYCNASLIDHKRIVFNIHGNSFRLVVDVEFRLKIIFIVWFGTHNEYDAIDVKKIDYANSNKK